MRPARLAIILLFLATLSLPALQMATGAITVPKLDENRRLAPPPPLSSLIADPSGFVLAAQRWFDDHYGLRDFFIRLKTQIDFSVFGFSEKLHIGKHGFLFYRSVIDVEEPQNERLSLADLDRAVANFAEIRDRLSARGIRLIVQTQQLKDKFYPEMLPRSAAFAQFRHRFDEFRAKLAALPGITYLDTTPGLRALKAQRPIFHKTDFHWNDAAAFDRAQTLVDTIAALSDQPVPFWRLPLNIVHRNFSGGQASFIPLFFPPHEDALFVAPSWDDSIYDRSNPAPFEWMAVRTREMSVPLLPPTVIFGDSFTDGMVRAGLTQHFRKLSYIRYGSAPLADALRAVPADTKFFVIEFIETALPSYVFLNLPAAPK